MIGPASRAMSRCVQIVIPNVAALEAEVRISWIVSSEAKVPA